MSFRHVQASSTVCSYAGISLAKSLESSGSMPAGVHSHCSVSSERTMDRARNLVQLAWLDFLSRTRLMGFKKPMPSMQ